jgi:hypothetical protein
MFNTTIHKPKHNDAATWQAAIMRPVCDGNNGQFIDPNASSALVEWEKTKV